MTNTAPLWLSIAQVAVPLVAALVAGGFVLANTVGRRIERLKNLVDIYDKFPKPYNHDFILERLMFQELQAIDRASTPWRKWLRRATYIVVALYLLGLIATIVPGVSNTNWSTAISATIVLMGGIYILILRQFKERRQKHDLPHETRMRVVRHFQKEWNETAQRNYAEKQRLEQEKLEQANDDEPSDETTADTKPDE